MLKTLKLHKSSTLYSTVFSVTVRPKIDKSHLKPITIKAGQSFGFDVPLEGEPPPEKEWYHEGRKIESPAQALIENREYGTMIEVILCLYTTKS